MENKTCPQCLKDKPINEFSPLKNRNVSLCKKCLYAQQRRRWKDRKKEAVALFGGKCQKCGYDKCLAALEFHHLDPKTKEGNWSKIQNRKWEYIIKELKKCILLCSNCHKETHWGNEINNNFKSNNQDNIFLNLDNYFIEKTGNCPICGKDVHNTKYCSIICSRMKNPKNIKPSKEKLQDEIENNSLVAVGKKYGVTDNAIRKWAKYMGIEIKPRSSKIPPKECPQCKKIFKPRNKDQVYCNKECNMKKRRENYPNKEELIKNFYNLGALKTSEIYDVHPKTVRQWVRYFGSIEKQP